MWKKRAYSDVNEEESVVPYELCISWNEVFQVKYKACSIVTMTVILSFFIKWLVPSLISLHVCY